MGSWKIHVYQFFSLLPSIAMLPRQILNSAPRFHGQLSHQQAVMQANQRALSLLTWYRVLQPALTCWNSSLGFPQAFNCLRLSQHQIPFLAPSNQSVNTSYNTSYRNVTMEHTSERDPKRRRSPSGSHPYSKSKVHKTRETDSSEQASRESMRTSRNRGFTQANWPKNNAECEWRRGPRNFESGQIQVNNVRIPKRPAHLTTSRGTDSGATGENTAPSCRTVSSSHSGIPPQSLSLQQSRYFHSSAATSQASRSDAKSTYKKRLWFNLPQHRGQRSKASSRDSVDFSIVSYNVLAQGLLEGNSYLYRHCERDILQWHHRKQKLLDEIQQADADVICLQEVESRHFHDFFQPALKSQGYACIYKKRTGDKADGCATFYKSSCFHEVSHSKLEYQRGVGILDRDNVAIVVMLQPKGLSSAHQLCVANTHLLWNPRRGDIKLAQLGLLFAEIERLSNTYLASPQSTYHPVVLCGDFNSVPHCPLYKFVKKGEMMYEGMAGVDVSGQELGRARVLMNGPLLPKEVGVSAYCRYVDTDVTTQSSRHSVHTGGAPRRNRQNSRDIPVDTGLPSPPDDIQGQLIHPFLFSSVYDHGLGNNEVTTNHSKTNCVVDYIFYTKPVPTTANSPHKPLGRPQFTGDLSLVKRLTLFTDSELRAMGGLPNAHWASDHLSLQATLRLTPND